MSRRIDDPDDPRWLAAERRRSIRWSINQLKPKNR
jgi:hypothetical protein